MLIEIIVCVEDIQRKKFKKGKKKKKNIVLGKDD